MNNYIQNKWSSKLLPGITNLLCSNGNMLLFNSYSIKDEGVRKIYCYPLCDTTIVSVENYMEDIWTEIEINHEISVPYNNGYICAGEGSAGSEGFICHTNEDKQLVWSYFFDFSNPIVNVKIKDNILECLSDNEILIRINLCLMSSVDVIYPNH